jgi:predicted dehydrogenase
MTRRELLHSSAFVAAGLPAWAAAIEPEAQVRRRRIGANDTIQVGLVGPGGKQGGFRQGAGVTYWCSTKPGTKIAAVCDVDRLHLWDSKNNNDGAAAYTDYRELLEHPGLDAVIIGTPDHWHCDIAVAALMAGKDVYCEKPLTLTIEEGQRIREAVKRSGGILQTGSQQRSDGLFQQAVDLVRNGRIGAIRNVVVGLPTGPKGGPFEESAAPESIDWNMWLGPAPWTPYIKERCHGDFRWWLEYSGGMLTDWGAHHHDIMQWGLGMDASGPKRIRGEATPQPRADRRSYSTFPEYRVEMEYEGGIQVVSTNTEPNGVKFIGDDGWIFVTRGEIKASAENILTSPLPSGAVKVGRGRDHMDDWLNGIRTRERCICNEEVGHRSATICHLANISLRLGGRELLWDAKTEKVTNDVEADAMKKRARRDWTQR